jgi:hypothetical protein
VRKRWLFGVFLGLLWQRGRKARSGGCGGFFFLADRGGEGVEELLGICIFLVWSLGLLLRALSILFLDVCWLHGGGTCYCDCSTGVWRAFRELLSGGL